MTALTCAHIVDTAETYDAEACAYVVAPVLCGYVAVRVWQRPAGPPKPLCLRHAADHTDAPLCYAGDDADG